MKTMIAALAFLAATFLSVPAGAYTYGLTTSEQGGCIQVSFTPRSYYEYYIVECDGVKGDSKQRETKTFEGLVSFCGATQLAIYEVKLWGVYGTTYNELGSTYHCFGAGGGGTQPPTIAEIRQAVQAELSAKEAFRIVENQYFWSGIELVNPTDIRRSVILHVGGQEKLVWVPAQGEVALPGSEFIADGSASVWIEGDENIVLHAGWYRR